MEIGGFHYGVHCGILKLTSDPLLFPHRDPFLVRPNPERYEQLMPNEAKYCFTAHPLPQIGVIL